MQQNRCTIHARAPVRTTTAFGVIGSGITLMLTMEGKIGSANGITSQVTAADAALRSDVRYASAITSADEHGVSLTVPGEAGRCRTAAWSLQEAGEKTQLVRVITQYPSYDTTANPVRCGGTAPAPETKVMSESVSPASKFGYANAGGRELVAVSGVLAPATGGTQPEEVPATKWGSNAAASVSLTASFGHGTAGPRGVWINQGAASLNTAVAAADMPSHAVSNKSLRAAVE